MATINILHMIVFLLNGKRYKWGSWGFELGFVIIYFNYVHKITDNDIKVLLFANDTNIIVTTSMHEGVQTV